MFVNSKVRCIVVIIKINGTPVSEALTVNEEGVNFNLDLHDMYEIVHTPVNVDISYSGHNIIKGDVNVMNWGEAALNKACDGIGFVVDHLF